MAQDECTKILTDVAEAMRSHIVNKCQDDCSDVAGEATALAEVVTLILRTEGLLLV